MYSSIRRKSTVLYINATQDMKTKKTRFLRNTGLKYPIFPARQAACNGFFTLLS